MRFCPHCSTSKPVEAFGLRSNGHPNSWCRECQRAYRKTPARRKQQRETSRKWENEHREQYRATQRARKRPSRPKTSVQKNQARQRIRHLIEKGRIVKPAHCSRCGEETPAHRLHGHHKDYGEVESVEWLCSVCHGKEHRSV